MGRIRRPLIIEDCLDGRVVKFSESNHWQLTKKICEKPWDGSYEHERQKWPDYWQPHEEHAVYECTQVRGSRVSDVAILKVRLEVPIDLPPSEDPKERAKDASGMRLNYYSRNEIEILQRLTDARCSVTPALLAFKVDVQDDSVLNFGGVPGSEDEEEWCGKRQWWMPGGYIVYILMSKLDAQPLDTNVYWDFDRQQRDEVRSAFTAAFLELRSFGVHHGDSKLENLMWNRATQKCYIIDMESADYDTERLCFVDKKVSHELLEFEIAMWHLTRTWDEPNE